MLRLLFSGLILSNIRRSFASHNQNLLHNRALANTCPKLNIMEQPFEKMAEDGVPKCDEPTKVAGPKREEQDLPKLTAQEFRVYNQMAEHMDMFVSHFHCSIAPYCSTAFPNARLA